MSTVTQDVSDRVLHIRLNRPDKRNALDNAMFGGLITAGERLKTEYHVATRTSCSTCHR